MEKLEHIAYLIPNTDVTGEMDRFRMLPGHIVHAERMWLDDVSEEAEQKMVREELPRAIRYLKGVAPYKCAVFGCTSASAANGKAGMEQIEKLMSDELSEILERPVITCNQCVIITSNHALMPSDILLLTQFRVYQAAFHRQS